MKANLRQLRAPAPPRCCLDPHRAWRVRAVAGRRRRSAAGHHAQRIRGLPHRDRRLRGDRTAGRRARAAVQRRGMRGVSQRAGDRRHHPDDRDARGAPRRRRQVSRRRLHDVVPDVLDSGSPMPGGDAAGGQRDRAADADPVVRRGTRRSGPRRDAARAGRSLRSRSATASAAAPPSSPTWPRDNAASAGSDGRRRSPRY